MINWDTIVYDINRARTDFVNLEIRTTTVEPINLKDEFKSLRSKMIKARDEIFEEFHLDTVNKLDYSFDLMFGLKLYNILNKDIGFTSRVATSDDVWRYLSVCVVPDIVHSRWSLNADHFYKLSRRIWLKTIWWYIHLAWRGTSESTFEILKNNTTDTILQLVERPGIGYYIELNRELMYQYSLYKDTSRELFRRVLKLNTARLLTVSPELMEGGLQSYVSDLFKTVQNKG